MEPLSLGPEATVRIPDLNNPTVTWPSTMTAHQLQLAALLAYHVLPATTSAPAPSALGIANFVDEWISAPYPQQREDRKIILEGLAWVDAEAIRCWKHPYSAIGDEQQKRMLDVMRLESTATKTPAGTFFRRFRFIVVGGYYTTPEGIMDIGYIGNVALKSYPPMDVDERTILDGELRKLGI